MTGLPLVSATKTVAVLERTSTLALAAMATVSTASRLGGGFHATAVARPRATRIAVQVSLATTPTALPRLTSLVPGGVAGMVLTVPPRIGLWTTLANFIPGTITSMPNTAEPSTLAGMSRRGILLPMNLVVVASVALVGGVRVAAVCTTSAKVAVRVPLFSLPPAASVHVPPYCA